MISTMEEISNRMETVVVGVGLLLTSIISMMVAILNNRTTVGIVIL